MYTWYMYALTPSYLHAVMCIIHVLISNVPELECTRARLAGWLGASLTKVKSKVIRLLISLLNNALRCLFLLSWLLTEALLY